MKIITYIVFVALTVNVAFAQETNQMAGISENDKNKIIQYIELDKDGGFQRGWSKGGLGIVNTNLYIVTRSTTNDANELLLAPTDKTEVSWKGESVTKTQVVIFYEKQIWSKENLPAGFNLGKSIVISFERGKVRFFDFQEMSGGYYDRLDVSH